MFNPLSKSRKLWAVPELLGGGTYGEHDSGAPLAEHLFLFFKYTAADFRHTRSHVKVATLRPQQTAIHCAQLPGTGYVACAWSRRCRARPNVETLQSCKHTASTGPGKRDRIAGFATSCYRHTRPPVPRRRPPSCHRSLQGIRRARTDVGSSQTCAHAAPMGAGKTQKSPQVEVTAQVVRADEGELTKLPGIATISSTVWLEVVHDQQRDPYDVGS